MSGQELLVNSIKQNKDDANLTTRNRQDWRSKNKFSGVDLPTPKQLQNHCGNCRRRHGRRNCPAFGKKCHSCSKLNRFEKMCRSKNVLVVQEGSDLESDSPYVISVISKSKKKKVSKAKVATAKLYMNEQRTENIVTKIQIDTGAQCNNLHVETYIKVPGGTQLKSVKT